MASHKTRRIKRDALAQFIADKRGEGYRLEKVTERDGVTIWGIKYPDNRLGHTSPHMLKCWESLLKTKGKEFQ